MSRYLLSVHTSGGDPRQMTPDQIRAGYERVSALEDEMKATGALVLSGRLLDPQAARVVDASNGRVTTTDGPYIESKEAIGGFYVIESENVDDALAWASKTSAAISMPIEVRPFWE